MSAPSDPNPFLAPTPLILDGGLATALEAAGHDLDDPLWSARLLLENPEAIRRVHRDFLEAGADVIATVSYQASFPGFASRGIDRPEAEELMKLASRLAIEARDEFWSEPGNRERRRRPLVAASVGPFGAFLADGSEYTGDYPAGRDELYAFHRDRWHLFAEGPADLLACETVPSLAEVHVLVDLMRETPDRWGWISVSCRDAGHISDGTPVGDVARVCDNVPNLAAIGVNCTKPEYVSQLLAELHRHSEKPLLAYPNAGEEYDAQSRSWVIPQSGVEWSAEVVGWLKAGATGVGGCCRVGPDRIREMRGAVMSAD